MQSFRLHLLFEGEKSQNISNLSKGKTNRLTNKRRIFLIYFLYRFKCHWRVNLDVFGLWTSRKNIVFPDVKPASNLQKAAGLNNASPIGDAETVSKIERKIRLLARL